MARSIRPLLMFQGSAEEAMNFYATLFADGVILNMTRHGPGEAGVEGSIMMATFRIAGLTVQCMDSAVEHAFGFTPALSLSLECESDEEVERLAAALAEGGAALMPLGDYGFSRRFAWINDRFGVSWQLTLP